MNDPDRLDDHDVARTLAEEAGRLLVELRARRAAAGASGRELGKEGDRLAHELLMERLVQLRPDDAVLSEEGPGGTGTGTGPGHDRLATSRVWIVDPLDGTREYGEVPRDDWAVHVALVVDGRMAAGAVALPAQELVLATAPAPAVPPAPPARPRVVVSRSRPPAVAVRLAEAIGGELVPMGSAGAKASAVVQGRADVYPHAGGQYEWDNCAPAAVARAAGVWASRLDGSDLVYNNPDPYLPDLLVCHPDLVERVRAALVDLGW